MNSQCSRLRDPKSFSFGIDNMKTRWMLSFTMWHINGEVVTETYGMLSKGMLAKNFSKD